MTSGDKSEGAVLDLLESIDGGMAEVRIYNWRGVVDDRADKGFESGQKTFFIFAEG